MNVTIDKLMFWRGGNWIKYKCKTTNTLRIHGDQLLITGDNKVFESLNMNFKVKGIYKEDVLILIFGSSHEMRKLKFQIKSNVRESIQKLGEYFPVVSYSTLHSNDNSFQYRSIEEILKKSIQAKDDKILKEMPANFNNFVKLCLLDPTFPQLVFEVQKILETVMSAK